MTPEEMQQQGLNTCDSCKEIHISEKLIWVDYDLEDIKVVNEDIYEYVALCNDCLTKLNKTK